MNNQCDGYAYTVGSNISQKNISNPYNQKREKGTQPSNPGNFNNLLEYEKLIRALEIQLNVEKSKTSFLNSQIENSNTLFNLIEKKHLETIKGDIKKLKMNSEKMKDQLNQLVRESEFLSEMSEYTSKCSDCIGKGALGEVYKALDSETAQTVAVKQIELNNISPEHIKSIQGEIQLLKNLNHPNIVKYIDFIQTKTHVNIILEYVEGGSLQQIIKENGMLGEHLVFIFVKQILEGLYYLHSQGIIHRDIKGANLLLNKKGVIKLADFGYSVLNDKDKTNSIVGTCCWMAPEIIEQKGNISSACDIWSLGSTIIQLLTTKPPYYDYPVFGAMYRIVTDDCPPLPENISENLCDFLKKCFIKDPSSRPTAKEMLNHVWITSPDKKLVKKFINQKETNGLPAGVINEWKNNYRDNLSSLTSSQHDNTRNEIREDEENHNCVEEEMTYINKSAIKIRDRLNENVDDYILSPRNKSIASIRDSAQGKDKTHKQSKLINKAESEVTPKKSSQLGNKISKELGKINHSLDNNTLQGNTKSLSFQQEENFLYKSKSFSDCEGNVNVYYDTKDVYQELKYLLPNIRSIRNDNIKRVLEDSKVRKVINDMFRNKDDMDLVTELKHLIHFILTSTITENELHLSLIKFVSLLNQMKSPGEFFSKHVNLVSFIHILNKSSINAKIVFLILHSLNSAIQENYQLLEEIILYQLFYHMTRLMFLFPDLEIKLELIHLINFLMVNCTGLIKLFLAAGGYFLLPLFFDATLLGTSGEVLLMLIMNYFLIILEKYSSNFEEVCLMFINNKVLSRLNGILLQIVSEEIENENTNQILNRILTLLVKFSELKDTEVICREGILKSVIAVSYSLPLNGLPKYLKIFENLMRDPMAINTLENIGYLECLVKLLVAYSGLTCENEQEQIFFQQITSTVLMQIKHMLKLNPGRCEQFAMMGGIKTLTEMINLRYTPILIQIVSDLINSSCYVREKLFQANLMQIFLNFLTQRELKDYYGDIIRNILDWIDLDSRQIETCLSDDGVFMKFFSTVMSITTNLGEHISILNEIFKASSQIGYKYFKCQAMVTQIIGNINSFNYTKQNIQLLNVTVDFLNSLSKHQDFQYIREINLGKILIKLLQIAQENNLVIIEEKIKKLLNMI